MRMIDLIIVELLSCHALTTNDGTAVRQGAKLCLETFCRGGLAVGGAVQDQAVEMHADVRRLRRRIGERNGPVEGDAGLGGAAELHQQRALDAKEIEVAG